MQASRLPMTAVRTWIAVLVLAGFLAVLAMPRQQAFAVQPDEVLADSVLEARARSLSHQLRCLVCQNQSIDDSDAPLARDLRILVRERLTAGDTDEQVKQFLVARFGDFVLLKPPFKGSTLLLWLAPLVLLLGGSWLVARQLKAQKAQGAPVPLTRDEERALSELMRPAKSDEDVI